MCGRYGLISDEEEILNRFEIEDFERKLEKLKPNYNVAPTHEMPVVERHSPNSLHYRQWGMTLNKWFVINARTDKIPFNNLWKKSIQENRVIIPADYFYEWHRVEKNKQPYLFRLKSKEIFGFAGFLVDYHDKDEKEKTGFIMLTTEANEIMKPIHDRLPCILKKENEEDWLNPDNVELEHLLPMLRPFPSELMECFPVSMEVNSVRNNSPEIVEKINLSDLQSRNKPTPTQDILI